MIRVFLGLILSIFISTSALAGDTAQRNILGFSPDGVWFAFEEFGTSDGTGAPYSSIYVININSDTWAKGTPIRVNFGEDVAPVSKARNAAMEKAKPILDKLKISEPGLLLASNPVTEIVANPRRIDFYRNKNLESPDKKVSYVLKEISFPLSQRCKTFGLEKEKGFALSITKGGAPLAEVYKDKLVPATRNCPSKYALSDVIEFNVPSGPTRHIVLIHRFSVGFEGPDTRFIAVPVTIK